MNPIEEISWFFQKRRLLKCRQWVFDVIESMEFHTDDWKLCNNNGSEGVKNEKTGVGVFAECLLYRCHVEGIPNLSVISDVERKALNWEVIRLRKYLWDMEYNKGKETRLKVRSCPCPR